MVIQTKSYTIEEFEEFIARPENGDRVFELIHGEIVEKVPTEEHSMAIESIFTLEYVGVLIGRPYECPI